ncbi:hypothetical protein VSR01_24380 [Actinacidiphila sp. DG2A-62]|uniref:hypothetical protein n=1 Tax=Actinacidiphila sp. DG2A-62 TaxID=3108821 RepID=UPI002DBB0247|nr:hypothetical protein [Actinacidiphila sp. DG2A-62]MEC3996478.1 hypothetical protein [Actinacidiphila sp. DG2A-62]
MEAARQGWAGLEVPRAPAGVLVAALLAAAFITLGSLAADASDAAAGEAAAATRGAAAHERSPADRAGLPRGAATGARVVYSLAQQRVWLVGPDGRVRRRFDVTPGGTPAPLGVYQVFARRAQGVGADGVQVEHAVFFAKVDGSNVGFSAPMRDTAATRDPDPAKLGTAIREQRADGRALWVFATLGRTVDVVT